MPKSFKLGLLPKVLIAIALGILLGNWMPHWGIRIFVTFNDIFSQLLGFLVPLIILGLVALHYYHGQLWHSLQRNGRWSDCVDY